MKTLVRSFAAASLVLGASIFAAGDEGTDDQVTGVVASVNVGYLEIDEGKHDGRTNFGIYVGDWSHLYKPKPGEKVRVYYRVSRRGKVYADKIEKIGK